MNKMFMGYMAHSATRAKINPASWTMELHTKCRDIVVKNILYTRVIKTLYIYYCMHVEHRSLFPRRSVNKHQVHLTLHPLSI